jgi:hypothetical protein
MPGMKTMLETILKNAGASDNMEEVMDACISIKNGQNIPALKGFSEDYFNFATIATDIYANSHSFEKVKKFAQDYWKPLERHMEASNLRVWSESEYASSDLETRNAALDDFLKDHGFATVPTVRKKALRDKAPDDFLEDHDFATVPTISKKALRDKARIMLERNIKRTGGIAYAESATAAALHSMFGTTEINGGKQPMIYPPEKVSSQPLTVLNNLVALAGQKLIDGIEKAGDRYLGDVPITMGKNDYLVNLKKYSIQDCFGNNSITAHTNRPVFAIIGGQKKKRNLNIVPYEKKPGVYSYGVLINEDDPNSFVAIRDYKGEIATIDLSDEGIQKLLYKVRKQ